MEKITDLQLPKTQLLPKFETQLFSQLLKIGNIWKFDAAPGNFFQSQLLTEFPNFGNPSKNLQLRKFLPTMENFSNARTRWKINTEMSKSGNARATSAPDPPGRILPGAVDIMFIIVRRELTIKKRGSIDPLPWVSRWLSPWRFSSPWLRPWPWPFRLSPSLSGGRLRLRHIRHTARRHAHPWGRTR